MQGEYDLAIVQATWQVYSLPSRYLLHLQHFTCKNDVCKDIKAHFSSRKVANYKRQYPALFFH